MANKNTLRWRRANPARNGASPVISRNLGRNMELAIVGGRTVYRPIDAGRPAIPTRTKELNKRRRSWGRKEDETTTTVLNLSVGTPRWASGDAAEEGMVA